MAGLANFRPYTQQAVEVGFVIVTEDSDGMVDIHDRRSVVLEPEDAWRWMNPGTQIEEAAKPPHIAQTRSLPAEVFQWWSPQVNKVDSNNNGKHLLAPLDRPANEDLPI